MVLKKKIISYTVGKEMTCLEILHELVCDTRECIYLLCSIQLNMPYSIWFTVKAVLCVTVVTTLYCTLRS